MKKLIIIGLFFVAITGQAIADEKADSTQGWKRGLITNINFSQVGLYNWAAGGENNISIAGIVSSFANYKKGHSSWDNTIDLAYGMVKPGDKVFRKTDDRIEFNSKYGHKAINKWNYSALFNFRSQFYDGFNYTNETNPSLISSALAPAFFTLALGMDYKPSDNFSIFASPLTGKTTYVGWQSLADRGEYGVAKALYDPLSGIMIKRGEKLRHEFGSYFKMNWQFKIMENVTVKTNLSLFSNYLDRPQNIDIFWDNLISLKVNKYLTTSITTNLIYDNDTEIEIYEKKADPITGEKKIIGRGPRTQFKEVLAIGLSFKL